MNILVRLKNPVFLLTFLATVVAFIYQVLGMFEVVPKVSEDQLIQLVSLIINVLTALGVLVDPTTKGVGDSGRAMSYTEPQ